MGPGPMGPMGPKIDENMIFSNMVFLVGKMFPDPVGVFCGLPWLPSGHIAQKTICSWFFGFGPIYR